MKLLLKTVLFSGLMAFGCRTYGESATFAPTADTSLFENEPDNNLGGSLSLVTGANASGFRSRELMRFDLTNQIPANAVIQSVTLTVKVVTVPGGGGTASVFDMHRMYVDWAEGTGTGNMGTNANDGESTWNNEFHPSTAWSSPGGGSGNDFSDIVSSSVLWSNVGAYTFTSTTDLVVDVQDWVADPTENFGWILISESESTPQTARRIGAREDTNNAPSLVVVYEVPPPIILENAQFADGTMQFSFLAQAGQFYIVQYTTSLTGDTWHKLRNVPVQPATTNFFINDSLPDDSQRFYRVVAISSSGT